MSAAASSASSPRSARKATSGGDELIQRVRKGSQIVQLACRLRVRILAEPVDPDDRHVQRDARCDVVEEALRDVDVRAALGAAPCEEDLPVPRGRLPRADLAGDDAELELDADL